MPLIDLLGPGIADAAAELGRPDGIISNLGMAIGMLVNPAAEVMRQHLRPEADAKEGLLLPERNGKPVDLAADEIVLVGRAHRTAKNDCRGMLGHALR